MHSDSANLGIVVVRGKGTFARMAMSMMRRRVIAPRRSGEIAMYLRMMRMKDERILLLKEDVQNVLMEVVLVMVALM